MPMVDTIYCNGKGCALRERCRRYTEGVRIIANLSKDTNQHRWMDHCDEKTREGYLVPQER